MGLEYHYGIEEADTLFEIVGSPQQLSNQLEQFQTKVNQQNETRPLTLIVNLGNVDWITLVIAYQSRQFYGYYVDSLGSGMPNDIRQTLEQARVIPSDLSIQQQSDGHNCGLWALENAADLNRMLRENQPLDWVANQLQRRRDENHFKEIRKHFAEKLCADATRILLNQGRAHLEPTLNKQTIQSSGPSLSEEDRILKNGQLFNAIRKNKTLEEKLEKAKKHLDAGAEVNASDANDKRNTPLHLAVLKGEPEMVKFLLERGAKTDIKNNDHETPLDMAKRLNQQAILQMLKTHIQLISQPASVGESSAIQQPPHKKRKDIDQEGKELGKKESKIPRYNPKLSVVSGRKEPSFIPSGSDAAKSKIPVAFKRRRPHSKDDGQEEVIQAGRSRISVLDKPKEYPASGLKYTLHGNIYQLKLLMLFLKRGLEKGYSFLLATEIDAAEKFDDLVFQYENERKDGVEYRFLQAKHKQDESKKITAHDLLTEENDEFSLQKYFISYRKIKQKPEFRGDTLKDFTLCTNINFDFDQLQQAHIKVKKMEENDDMLNMECQEKSAVRYQFMLDTASGQDRLYQTLKDTSDLRRLAKKLAEHVLEGKKIDLTDSTSEALFASYHMVLAKEVIDTSGQGAKQFRQDFLQGKRSHGEALSIEAQQFRKAFFEAALKRVTIRLSKDFKITEINQAVKLEGPQKTAESIAGEFANLIVNAKQGQKIVLDGTIYRRNSREEQKRSVANNVDKLGCILVGEDKQNVHFSNLFINRNHQLFKRLPYLKELRTQLEEKLKLKSIDITNELSRYEFEIKIGSFTPCTAREVEALLDLRSTLPDNTPESERLAKVLAQYLLSDQHIDLNNPGNEEIQFLKSYYPVLVKEEIIEKIKKGNEFYIRFNNRFLENDDLSEPIKREFLSTCREVFEGYFIDNYNKKEILLSENFGNKNPKLTNPDSLARTVAELILAQQKKGAKIVEIKTEDKIVTQHNINALAGYVLNIQDNEIKFSQDFFNDNNGLPGNLNTFRTHLKIALEDTIRFDKLKQYQFGIKGFYCQSTLPNDEIKINDIKDFFNKLVFAVNQPSEIELGNIIKREIGEDNQFNLIDSDFVADYIQREMLDWFKWKGEKGKEGKFLSHEDGEALFAWTKRKLAKLILIGPTLEYRTKIKKFGIEFKQHTINELQLDSFLTSESEKQIFNIVTQHNTLSAIKVYQALKVISEFKSEYKHDDSYIFIRLSSLLRIQNRVIQAFKSETSNLLIIECKEDKSIQKEEIEQLYNQLSSIINSDTNNNKKIVLVTKQDDALSSLFKTKFSVKYEEKTDKKNSFINLTDKSQEKLLEKGKIIFQGYEIRLKGLLNINDEDAKGKIDAGSLSNLINDEEIEVGSILEGLDDVKHYYIDRTFNRKISLKDECLKALDIPDIFAISNVGENELSKLISEGEEIRKFEDSDSGRGRQIRFVILNDESAEENFKQLSNNDRYSNIHWLKRENNQLTWQQSKGTLSNLRKFIDEESDSTRTYSPNKISDIDDKVVIIAAGPGMGKSTVLTYLAEQTKESSPSLWVVRINLNDYTRKLLETNFNANDITQATTEAINFLSEVSNFKTSLEKEMFQYRLRSQGGIALLFDGFDEISPHYKDKVIQLLELLKGTKSEKIWITTRPYIGNELEDSLSLFSYTLEPFSRQDQEVFLTKFWSQGLSVSEINEQRLEIYIARLLNLVTSSIRDKEAEFTGIPLQTRMLAEAFQKTQEGQTGEGFEEFYCSNKENPDLPDQLDLVDLYQRFIDKKYKIYCEEKQKQDTTIPAAQIASRKLYSVFIQEHRKLALYTLLKKEELEKLLSEQCEQKIKSLIDPIIKGEEKTGIIDRVIEEKPRFTHRTFAEYFAADFLADQLAGNRQDQKARECLLTDILVKPDYQVIRAFLNGQLIKTENSPSESTLTEYGKCISELWSREGRTLRDNNNYETLLHIAVRENNIEIVSFLFNSLKKHKKASHSLVLAGDPYRQTVLHLSVKFGNLKLVKSLLSYVKDIVEISAPGTLEDLLLATAESEKTTLHIAADSGNVELVKWLLDYVKDNFSPETLKSLILANAATSYAGGTALHIAARSGNTKLVKELLSYVKNIVKTSSSNNTLKDLLLATTEYRENILHIEARNGNAELVKWLLEFVWNSDEASVPCILKTLLFASDRFARSKKHGDIILHIAAKSDNWELVKWLLKFVRNTIEASDPGVLKDLLLSTDRKDRQTALHIGMKKHNPNFIKWLLKFINTFEASDLGILKDLLLATDRYGETALHMAATSDDLESVQWLLEFIRDTVETNAPGTLKDLLLATNMYGTTTLRLVAHFRNTELVKWLLDYVKGIVVGSNPDTLRDLVLGTNDFHGNILLGAIGLDAKNWEFIKFLLNYVKDNIEDSFSGTLKKLLLPSGMSKETALHRIVESGNLESVKSLLDYVKDIVETRVPGTLKELLLATEGRGQTVLHQIAEAMSSGKDFISDNLVLVEFLLDYMKANFSLETLKSLVEVTDRYKQTALYIAARFGKAELVKRLLRYVRDNIETNAPGTLKSLVLTATESGQTTLHAALSSNTEIVKALLQETQYDPETLKALVLTPDKDGLTALHLAAKSDNAEAVKALLNSMESDPATLEAMLLDTNGNGETALHMAATGGHPETVKLLIENGAQIQATTNNNATPLHLAAANGHPESVKLLIENGAQIQAVDNHNMSPLHLAAQNGNLETVKALLDSVQTHLETLKSLVLVNDIYKHTPLRLAAEKNHVQMVKVLLNSVTYDPETLKAMLDITDSSGQTILHWAVQEDKSEMVKVLLNSVKHDPKILKFLVMATDYAGQTALHLATEHGKSETVKALLNGVTHDPETLKSLVLATKSDGQIALHMASANGHLEIVKLLLEQMAQVNAVNKDNWTSLHLAAFQGHTEIVQMLLAHLQDYPNWQQQLLSMATASDGLTPLHLAAFRGHTEIVQAVLAPVQDYPNQQQQLLSAMTISENLSPLHLATRQGHLPVTQLLLEKGADFLARNNHDTVLHRAVSGNNVEIIRLILEAIKEKFNNDRQKLYPHINAPDTEGDTPLMWAAEGGKIEAAQILLSYGVDINAKNNEGMSALDWSIQADHLGVAVVLLENNDIKSKHLNEAEISKLIDYHVEHHAGEQADLLITKLLASDQSGSPIQSQKT